MFTSIKRNPEESYEDYRVRRKNEQKEVNLHLQGTVFLAKESGQNRKQRREVLSKTKHSGRQSKYTKSKSKKLI